MSTSKPSPSARPPRTRRATPPPAPQTELEKPRRRSKPMRLAPGASNSAPESVSAAIQRALAICAHLSEDDPYPAPEALADVHRTLEQALTDLEVLASSVMRVRDQTFGDRRVKVEYLADPTQPGSVLLRLVPSTAPAVMAPAPDLIRTSEAAALLGLSRPHVAMLCDQGELGSMEVTQGGHRRVSRAGVMAYRETHLRERAALDGIEGLTQDLRAREHQTLLAAGKASGIRWTKMSGQAREKPSLPAGSKTASGLAKRGKATR